MKKTFILASLLIFGLLSCEKDNRNEYENDSSNNQENTDTEEHDEVIVDDYDYESVIYPQGAVKGVFSVSKNKRVCFSQGNLQYQASTDTWRFAEHQYDVVGMGYGLTDKHNECYVGGNIEDGDNREISSMYDGWIDLFGWGTGNNPTNSSVDDDDYPTFVDWGINKISNGGNVGEAWFTLASNEWYYLFKTRLNASSKQGIAMVNGICGLVLLPDNWKLPNGSKFTSGYTYYNSDYEIPYFYKRVNTYTKLEWQVMEEAGAVFLPAAGFRDGLAVWSVGKTGYYWSRTQDSQSEYSEHLAYIEDFYFGSYTYNRLFRSYGSSVRLCSEIK